MSSELPADITIGDKYRPAMEMDTPEEAAEYFERCVRHAMSFGKTREEAESTERANLGYYAGYYDAKTADRVKRMFGAPHPIFGNGDGSTGAGESEGAVMSEEAEKRCHCGATGELVMADGKLRCRRCYEDLRYAYVGVPYQRLKPVSDEAWQEMIAGRRQA